VISIFRYSHILTTSISSRFIKKFFDNAPSGRQILSFVPAVVATLKDATDLNNPNKRKKIHLSKKKHFSVLI
jgi:hypothetical protein